MRMLHFDMSVCWKSLTGIICWFFLFGIYYGFTIQNLMVIPVTIMIWQSMAVGLPFNIGNKYGLDKLLSSFPINRKNVIKGRYLFALIIGAFGIIQSEVMICILGGLFHVVFDIKDIYFSLCCSFVLFCLIVAIHMPMYFRLAHAQVIQISPIFLYLIFIISIQIYYMTGSNFNIKPVTDKIWDYGILTLGGSIMISGVILALSYLLTCKVFTNKDL